MSDQGDRLRGLKPNWDSCGADPPLEKSIAMAEHIEVCLEDLGPWSMVPLSDGGVQLEVHRGGWDIEIAVEPALAGGEGER